MNKFAAYFRLLIPLIVIFGYLIINRLLGPGFVQLSEKTIINHIGSAQVLGLLLAVLTVFITLVINPSSKQLLKWGDWNLHPAPVKLLGIKAKDKWRRTGPEVMLVISLATGLFMYLGSEDFSFNQWLMYLPFTLGFSAVNALNEELITRFGVIGLVKGHMEPRTIYLASGIIFGIPHYWGHPSGIIGVLMAGFLGWFLAKATFETKGLGLAWMIHLVQDIIIFSFLFQNLP